MTDPPKIVAIRTWLTPAAASPDGAAAVKPFLELLEIAAMAEAFSVALSPHNYNSATLAMAAMLHASALIPNLLTAELYPGHVGLGESFAATDFEIVAGHATLPRAPGLGVTIREDALTALAGSPTAYP